MSSTPSSDKCDTITTTRNTSGALHLNFTAVAPINKYHLFGEQFHAQFYPYEIF